MYIDRTYRFGSPIPASINGQFTLRTANDDKFSSANATHVSFTVNQASTVYIVVHNGQHHVVEHLAHRRKRVVARKLYGPNQSPGGRERSQGSKEDVCRWCDRDPQWQWVDNSISSMYNIVVVP